MRRSHGEAVSGAAQVIKRSCLLAHSLNSSVEIWISVRRNVGFVRNFGVCLDPTYFGAISYKFHIGEILEAREGGICVNVEFARTFGVCLDSNFLLPYPTHFTVAFCQLEGVLRLCGFVRNFCVCIDPNLVSFATHLLVEFWQPWRNLVLMLRL